MSEEHPNCWSGLLWRAVAGESTGLRGGPHPGIVDQEAARLGRNFALGSNHYALQKYVVVGTAKTQKVLRAESEDSRNGRNVSESLRTGMHRRALSLRT